MSVLSISQVGIKKRRRVGRGLGSGRGSYSGRGSKGQKARTGGGVRPGFEGGQMPLYRRLPKRGFKSLNHIQYNILNIASLNILKDGEAVTIDQLKEKGLIKQSPLPVKLLGNGELKIKNLSLVLNSCSSTAKGKVESLGGKIELI